jgi:putative thiamine transport system substrate-binding protein
MLRALVASAALALSLAGPAGAADPDPRDWPAVLTEARGQTVYWNAWAGEPRINAYIDWVGREVSARYGVTLNHVKLTDTAEAVARVVAEKAAGKTEGGAVDLIWINGENFASMKRNGLLMASPWAVSLPGFKLTDPERNSAVLADFTVPTDGQESPWGKAQIVFFHDTADVKEPPRSMPALLDWAKANPGRFTYPLPPDFLGSTFLKQALIELAADKAPLYRPVEEADFAVVTKPLWDFVDALHPHLWRQGKAFPNNSADLRRLMADGETSIGFAFNPSEASAAIANKELPDTVRSYVLDKGTIGNVHFVTIPFNAAHKAGAMVVADFLLSAEAQAMKQDPKIWGDFTVLAIDKLDAADKARFEALDLGIATLTPAELGAAVPEPHPSWMVRVEKEWAKRYTAG